jgi:PAS domain S-box-containing protein
MKRKDGSVFYADINSGPVKLDGRDYLMGIFRDITASKEAEEALHASEETLKNMLESSPDAITVTDLDGNITECNPATLELHGFSSKEELIGKSAFDFITTEDRERASENLKKTLENGSLRNLEYNCLTKDGSTIPVELSASVILDKQGKPSAFVGITKDISERKMAEEKIKKQISFQNALFNISVGLSSDLIFDDFMTLALKNVCEALDATDVSFFMIQKNRKRAQMTHNWENGKAIRSKLRNVRMRTFSDSVQELFEKGFIKGNLSDKGTNRKKKLRSVMKRTSIKSFLGVPVMFANTPAGYIGVHDCVNERDWNEDDLTFLQSASRMVGSNLENSIIRSRYDERLQNEDLVSKISLVFMSNKPFDEKIDFLLSSIGDSLRASRTYLFVRSKDGKHWSDMCEWDAKGFPSLKEKLKQVDSDRYKVFVEKLEKKEILTIPRMSEVTDPNLKEIMKIVGSRGGFIVPIHVNGKLWGTLGFGYSKEQDFWKEENIALLLTGASMLGWLIGNEKKHLKE